MACVHNQAKINSIRQEIQRLQKDLTNLNNNIAKCTDIQAKHESFSTKLQCVVDNLQDNYVEAGKKYDNGKMELRKADADQTVEDCKNIILESKKQVTTIENTIRSLEQQMANLDGDCSQCVKDSGENEKE